MATSTSGVRMTGDLELPRGMWLFLVVMGVLSVGGGILAIAYPDITLLVISIILGVQLLVFGAIDLVDAFIEEADVASKIVQVLLAILGVIAGVIVLRRPGESLLVLVIAAGLYLVIAGIVLGVRAIARADQRAVRALAALATFTLGVLILAWPEISLGTLAILTGIGLIVRGAFAVFAGLQLRRLSPDTSTPMTVTR